VANQFEFNFVCPLQNLFRIAKYKKSLTLVSKSFENKKAFRQFFFLTENLHKQILKDNAN